MRADPRLCLAAAPGIAINLGLPAGRGRLARRRGARRRPGTGDARRPAARERRRAARSLERLLAGDARGGRARSAARR